MEVKYICKKYLLTIIVIILIALSAGGLIYASDISNAKYLSTISITDNGSTPITNSVATFNLSTADMKTGGMLSANASDLTMRTPAGVDIAVQPSLNATYPWCTWVDSISAYSTLYQSLYTKDVTGGKIRYFPGTTGATVTDNASMEMKGSGNWTWKGWFDPTSSGYLLNKAGAITVQGNGSGNLTAMISGSDLLYAAASSQYCNKAAGVISPAGGNVTLDSWVYRNTLTGTWQVIVADGNWAGFARWELSMDNTQHLNFTVGNVAGAAYAAQWVQTGTIALNTWHFITAVYDNTAATKTLVYVDGATVAGADTGVGGNINQPNNNLSVGALWSGAAYQYYFNGYIDEVRITQGTRTLANHIAAYNGGWGVPFTVDGTTISLWHFNEGVGNPVDNEAGTNNLVRVNNPTWLYSSPVAPLIKVNTAIISAGEHTISTFVNGAVFGISVDTAQYTTAFTGNITDNVNVNTIDTAYIMPYLENVIFKQGATQKGNWTWQYAATVTDQSGNGNTMTPSFRTTASNNNLVASVITQDSTLSSNSPSANATGVWAMIGTVPPSPDNMFTEGGFAFPLGSRIVETADALGQNREEWLFAFVFVLAIIAAVAVYAGTHVAKMGQKGSLLLSALAAELVLIFFYRTHTIPGLALVPFGIIALLLIVWRKSPAPVD